MENSSKRNRAVIVPASAGSGKTYRIAHEYLYDTLRNRTDEDGKPYFDRLFYKRILAVTFTNKATEEMKSRILKEIHLLASGENSAHLAELIKQTSLDEATLRKRAKIIRSQILHDYSHFTILTNDTFFQRILRAFVKELGIDMNFSTELDSAPILTRSIDALIESITGNQEIRQWLEELTEERINDGERWDIRSAIASLSGELFKESTKDIIAKCSHKEGLKSNIFRFNTTVKRQQEALRAKGAYALHIIAERGYSHDDFKLKFTKVFDKVANGTLDKITEAVARHMSDSPVEWFNKGRATADLISLATQLQEILVDIYNDHLDLVTLENTQRILSRNYRGFALLHDLQEKVNKICREDNSMLLSETKHAIAGFISESEAPFIYEKVGNYFDKFMIDEFQDTSTKEWQNFLPLLRNAMSQSNDTSVLIVGDVKQAIYRWRGGDWRILNNDVKRSLIDCNIEPLQNNWRSLPNIVEFNNLLYTSIIERENNRLNLLLDNALQAKRISKEIYDELYNTLQNAYSNHKQIPRRKHINCGYISIVAPIEGANTTPQMVSKRGIPLYIERIKEVLEQGFSPCDITILVRKNSDGMDIAEELLFYRDMLPKELWFEITTEEALRITASAAVQLIIAIMRLALNRNDITSLVQYNHLCHNDQFDRELDNEEQLFLDTIRAMSPEDAFQHIVIHYSEYMNGETAYIMALHEHISHFSAGKVADLQLFDKWWREKGESLSVRVERSKRTIEILTIHKAKGLENKVVIIPRCAWSLEPMSSGGQKANIIWSKAAPNNNLGDIGEFPVSYNNSVEESLFADGYFRERIYTCVDALNLLYVATTRAKEQLHLFLPSTKSNSNIGSILLENFATNMQQVGDLYRHYTIGTFDAPEAEERTEDRIHTTLIKQHHASPINLKLRTSVSRYFQEEIKSMSPRSAGIHLHRAFEGASTRQEIFDNLGEMHTNGVLQASEVAALKEQIVQTLDTTVAGEWFDGSWSKLHSERSIILPDGTTKRPDRVMIRHNEAVVVDYKFGEEKHSYAHQVEEYMEKLRQMGYSSVKGYIWYVGTGNIVQIGV